MAEDLLQPWDHQPRGVFQQETTIFLSQLLGATETSEFCFPGASPEGFTM
ncbi:unnamed protein product [Cladocopium goreaui]|uniref:Uncharacterized protein n=1 Tax=Cladocopium goreaui TaxID=2562237 RepID=A0A9P1GN54_9DINO|nr:unnamed protein product [Cladocopium goreaui]CAI4017884.1 unnamed protein product [Cladocopium goreaui]